AIEGPHAADKDELPGGFHVQTHGREIDPLKAVAAAGGIPFRTAQRWMSLYRQFGLAEIRRFGFNLDRLVHGLDKPLTPSLRGYSLSLTSWVVEEFYACLYSSHLVPDSLFS